MQTITHIRTHGIASLLDLHITPRRHKVYPNLVMLKYHQVLSPMDNPIVQECRGLILDEADDFRVISRPYDKFFNYGEPLAAALDWPTARLYEKLDGSLMTLYFYDHKWHVASSGTPDASGPVADHATLTFADLFWNTWRDLKLQLPSDPNLCHMFELLTPLNRIVVRQLASSIILHGTRNLTTMAEQHPEPIAHQYGWPCVRQFPLTTLKEILAATLNLNPMDAEGYVVTDSHFHRLKIKNPRYVALAHIKDGITPRRIIELIQKNETAEVLTYFPELTSQIQSISQAITALAAELESDYAPIRDIPSQKDFAAAALKTRCSAALFNVRAGKSPTMHAFLLAAPSTLLCKMLGLKQADQDAAPPNLNQTAQPPSIP
ncbi:MAG TPA: T4 RnlA family RNA ligase [Phycisphaerae bacterium]|jgi:hypothetical protein